MNEEINYKNCLYCKKFLKRKSQKRLGYCNIAHSLAHLHFKQDLIMQKLEAEEQEFDSSLWSAEPVFEFGISDYLQKLSEEDLPGEK